MNAQEPPVQPPMAGRSMRSRKALSALQPPSQVLRSVLCRVHMLIDAAKECMQQCIAWAVERCHAAPWFRRKS
jgi:hypothetical protein